MIAYRTYLTITDPKQVTIADVPFQAGQVAEVLLLAQDVDRTLALPRLKTLFEVTQSLPQVQQLTEDDIASEIEAYRSGQ